MTKEENLTIIDIGKIIRSQKAPILKKMPRFIIRIIERIIHQKELNDLFFSLKDVEGFDFLDGLVEYFEVKAEVKGFENLPDSNRLIFALNHSMGAFEGFAALHYLKNLNPDIKLLINSLLANIKNSRPFLLPVNSFGRTGKTEMLKIAETYESETNIFTFPAGRVSRIIDGKVRDSDWHRSFIENAKRYKREIVPIYIENINSKLFYRIFKLRKFFRIRANIELFLLPHELFLAKKTIVKMRIGKPIPHTVFTNTFSTHQWAQKIKEHVYKFEKDYNITFTA